MIPQIVFDWAQRAFEGTIIKHEGKFYRAGDTYSIPVGAHVGPGGYTMDIMLWNTKRVVEELDPARVREVDYPFSYHGVEGTMKGYELNE